jgi:hypothetical protein
MGKCIQCEKETNDSATIYQADLTGTQKSVGNSSTIFADTTTTTTVKTYANVRQQHFYCCKECRSEKGLWKFALVCTIIGAALTALCWLGGPWRETNIATIIKVICVLGTFVFGFLTAGGFFWTISKLIYPYGSIESTLVEHLNKPENNQGHTYLTKAEGDKLKRIN